MIAVPCTWVQKPAEKDWGKPILCMKWLNKTKNNKMTFDTRNGISTFEWCMDASFATHPDFRSHTDGSGRFTGGQGCPINVSAKQKINVDSSATTELAAVGQLPSLVMWVPLFLGDQGCPVKNNCVHQDNNSTILLEKNRKASSSKQTRAMNTHCFMVTDHVKQGKSEIVQCNTDNMIGDYFMKGLQGVKFSKFWKIIMGN